MVRIHGRSDDAIEMTGEIEEIIECLNGKMSIAFDDGSVIKIEYEKKSGMWGIKVVTKGEGFHRLEPARARDIPSVSVLIDAFEYQVI